VVVLVDASKANRSQAYSISFCDLFDKFSNVGLLYLGAISNTVILCWSTVSLDLGATLTEALPA
jgi:hypothetical protein